MGLSDHRRHGRCVDIGEDAASHALGKARSAESASLPKKFMKNVSLSSSNAHLLSTMVRPPGAEGEHWGWVLDTAALRATLGWQEAG